MHAPNKLVYILFGLAPLAALADLQVDADDISSTCQSICRPVRELGQACNVNDDDNMSDQTENLLELQCYCTNDSFDVASISSLCASCMQQNPVQDNDDDDDDDDDDDGNDNDRDDNNNNDINEIMSRCGFSSTSYAAAQSTSADGVTVAATRPSNSAQLTTTITGGTAATGGSSSIVTTTGTTTSGGSTITTTGTSTTAANTGGASTTSTGGSGSSTDTATSGAAGPGSINDLGALMGLALGVVAVSAYMA